MKLLKFQAQLAVFSFLFILSNSFSKEGTPCVEGVENIFAWQARSIDYNPGLTQQFHRAYDQPNLAPNSRLNRSHTYTGDVHHDNGQPMRLRRGMHTDYGVNNLLENNIAARNAIIDPNTGRIASDFIHTDPSGVRVVFLPEEAFIPRVWRRMTENERRRASGLIREVDGRTTLGKTLFPQSWGPREIEDAAAYVRRQTFDEGTGMPVGPSPRRVEYNGVTLEVQYDRDGNMNSLFPVAQGL